MTRRVVLVTFLFVALAVAGVGWAETAPDSGAFKSAVTLTRPPGLAIDVALPGRSEVLSTGWSEQRLPTARVRLGLAVIVGVSVLLAAAIVTLTRPSPAPHSTLWCRWSLALRAPPPPLVP